MSPEPLTFTPEGLLPLGDYPMTIAQLRESLLVKGPGMKAAPNWDAAWRLELVDNLAVLAR